MCASAFKYPELKISVMKKLFFIVLPSIAVLYFDFIFPKKLGESTKRSISIKYNNFQSL